MWGSISRMVEWLGHGDYRLFNSRRCLITAGKVMPPIPSQADRSNNEHADTYSTATHALNPYLSKSHFRISSSFASAPPHSSSPTPSPFTRYRIQCQPSRRGTMPADPISADIDQPSRNGLLASQVTEVGGGEWGGVRKVARVADTTLMVQFRPACCEELRMRFWSTASTTK